MTGLIEKDEKGETVVRPVRWSEFSLAEIIKPSSFICWWLDRSSQFMRSSS